MHNCKQGNFLNRINQSTISIAMMFARANDWNNQWRWGSPEKRKKENPTINLAGDCCHEFLVVVKCKDTCTHNTRKALSSLDWLNN
jgi:hypothetical protein